ncbi:MAG: helix-turn-helix domain-containing protein [Candidatus Peregrinibacteria bacterium]
MDDRFFTTDQVAKILQVHPFTILKFIKEGKMKGLKLGRVYRILESDVKIFIEERMTQPKEKTQAKKKVEQEEKKTPTFELKNDKGDTDHYHII